MNIPKMIAELQAEKERLDEAIVALERLAAGNKAKRRGKPPRSGSGAASEPDAEPSKARAQSSG
jgi:hypothetical protein